MKTENKGHLGKSYHLQINVFITKDLAMLTNAQKTKNRQ